MKKVLGWLLIIILIPICYLLIINMETIDVSEYDYANSFKEQRKVRKSGVNFSIILTGTATTSEAFVFKGGSLFKPYSISHSAIFVKHPKGNILFDTGLGSHIDEQFETEMPSELKFLMNYDKKESAISQLEQNGYTEDSLKMIIPSHLHWDHAGGLEDFSNTHIFIPENEKSKAFEDSEKFKGYFKSQYDNEGLKWQAFNFKERQFENFERSLDLYDDGSIILLPISGHTPGSIALLITTHTGDRYLFTGDLTWSQKGQSIPAEKFSISSDIVDSDQEYLKESIARVYYLKKRYPELYIVPTHDYEVQKKLGFFPKFIK